MPEIVIVAERSLVNVDG